MTYYSPRRFPGSLLHSIDRTCLLFASTANGNRRLGKYLKIARNPNCNFARGLFNLFDKKIAQQRFNRSLMSIKADFRNWNWRDFFRKFFRTLKITFRDKLLSTKFSMLSIYEEICVCNFKFTQFSTSLSIWFLHTRSTYSSLLHQTRNGREPTSLFSSSCNFVCRCTPRCAPNFVHINFFSRDREWTRLVHNSNDFIYGRPFFRRNSLVPGTDLLGCSVRCPRDTSMGKRRWRGTRLKAVGISRFVQISSSR